jgi:tetratricopeptide (TPR) repeat protein
MNPIAIEGLLWRGIALLGLGKGSEALVDFETACNLRGDSYDAFLLRAFGLEFLERYQQELTILDTVLTLDPNSFDAHYLRGKALTSLNKIDEALQSYRRAFAVASTTHRSLADTAEVASIKLKLALRDNNFPQAKSDWEQLREFAYKEGGEAFWFETVSALVRDTTNSDQRGFLRRLIGASTADEPMFPLARALDYVIEGDEALIEKLSPEVRGIVDEIVDSLQKSSPARTSKKKPTKRSKRTRS